MGDRYRKEVKQVITTETLAASGEIVSQPFNTYDYTVGGILADVSGDGVGGFSINIQVSPDQGNTWFTVLDNINAENPTTPFKAAYGSIPIPGAWGRIIITGGTITGSYLISVWFVGYYG